MSEIFVEMSEISVANSPEVLVCKGIGSCLAITMYDHTSRLGGMAHSMLSKKVPLSNDDKPGRYVDSAIAYLLNRLQKSGAKKEDIGVKLVGGADMFPNLKIGFRIKISKKRSRRKSWKKRSV